MEAERIKLSIRITGTTDDFEIDAHLSDSISDVKIKCGAHMSIDPSSLKLIYKGIFHIGKILKDPEILSELALDLTQKIYLVRSMIPQEKSESQPIAPQHISSGAGELTGLLHGLNHFGVMNQATSMMESISDLDEISQSTGLDMPDPAFLRQMMSNPATRQFMMNSLQQMMSNPQMREWMFNSNPQLRQLSERMPGIRDALGSPQVIQQMMSAMERMSVGSTTGPMSGTPESFPAPGGSSNAETVPSIQPAQQPTNQNAQSQQVPMYNPYVNPMFQNPTYQPPMFQAPVFQQPPQSTPAQQAPQQSPQPQMPHMPPQYQMYNPYGYYGMPYPQPQLPFGMQPQFNPFMNQPPVNNPREAFREQLQKLNEMGFINEEANLKALQESVGNVDLAIEKLLRMLG